MAERRLEAHFIGRDSLTPVLNRINGSLTNTARISDEAATRSANYGGLLARQWGRFQHAFGHAFTYGAVYQFYQAYNNLKNFNSELGTLNAMLPNAGSAVDELGNVALRVSTLTGAPLNDVQESINNIIQSMPNMSAAVRQHLVPVMAQIEAMSGQITDVDPRSFGSRVLSMARAFRGSPAVEGPNGQRILERIASQMIKTRFSTPALTGQELVRDIGTVQSGAIAGGFDIPNALALFTVVQRTVGRSAQSAQYLRQLMIRMRKPTKQEMPFYQQAGLSQEDLVNLTGPQILRRLIEHGLSLPGGLNSRDVQQAIRSGNQNLISPTNQAAQFFMGAVGGRMQSLIAMNAIVRGLGQWKLQLDQLNSGSNDLNRQFDVVRQRRSLQVASNALSNMTTDILQNFMPALSTGSTGLRNFGLFMENTVLPGMRRFDQRAGRFVNRHFGGGGGFVSGALDTGLTVGGLTALFKGGSLIRGLYNILRGNAGRMIGKRAAEGELLESKVGRTLMRPFTSAYVAEASLSALAGQANGTPAMPFWVVIHPLSMTTVPGLFGGRTGSKLADDTRRASTLLKILQGFGLRGALRTGAAAGLFAPEIPALKDAINMLRGKDPLGANARQNMAQMRREGFSSTLSRFFTLDKNNNLVPRSGTPQWMVRALNSTRGSGKILGFLPGGNRDVNEDEATKLINSILSGQRPNTFRQQPRQRQMPQRHQQNLRTLRHLNSVSTAVYRGGHITVVQIPNATPGQYLEGVFNLEPTPELKKLLKPQEARVHIPINQVGSAPTERGKRKVTRNRG